MKYLLDTHLLLWAVSGSSKLGKSARRIIENPDNELYFSVISLWEIAVKEQLGKLHLPVGLPVFRRVLSDNGYTELNLNGRHVMSLTTLPGLHKDPFDRMLLSQAQSEGFVLLSSDAALIAYGAPVKGV